MSSTVSDITFTPAIYDMEARVNAGDPVVTRIYEDPIVTRASGFPTGYERCGERLHYIADYDASASSG